MGTEWGRGSVGPLRIRACPRRVGRLLTCEGHREGRELGRLGRSMARSQFETEPNIHILVFHLNPNPGLHFSHYHDMPHFLTGRESSSNERRPNLGLVF